MERLPSLAGRGLGQRFGFAWRERFMAEREQVIAMYDERFARMWEIYLSASENAFAHGSSCVFQMQLGRNRDAVPLSRGYMTKAEAQLAAAENP